MASKVASKAPVTFTIAEEFQDPHLKLAHAFGVYPAGLRDAILPLGDDAALFCVGRQVAVCELSRKKLSFLARDTRLRVLTAAARSPSGKLLAIAERVGQDDAVCQISILRMSDMAEKAGEAETLKVLLPANKRLDIISLAFTCDSKFLISLSDGPDYNVTYWRWEIDKAVSSHDIQQPVSRLAAHPKSPYQFSVSGLNYLRMWDYNPNDHHLREMPSMFPLKQEKAMKLMDHCWVLGIFLCAVLEDGFVHIFEEGEHRLEVDIQRQVTQDESSGPKALEREQAKALAQMMGGGGPLAAKDPPPLKLATVAAWSNGFVVGGDQGYLGVFKLSPGGQVEPSGTFRMKGEDSTLWQLAASSEDTYLTILHYKDEEQEGAQTTASVGRANSSGLKRGTTAAGSARQTAEILHPSLSRKWDLSTFPLGQADLSASSQAEMFTPLVEKGLHFGPIVAMGQSTSRRTVITCGSADKSIRVWGYPADEGEGKLAPYEEELSLQAAAYETPLAMAVHPLGFQVAIVLEDMVRVYHLTTQQAPSRTLFDLPLKKPGCVAYSNSGDMLAVTSENDVALIDPIRAVVIHMFAGRGGHLSPVNRVLFSEDDRLLVSSAVAPHGAIYGWDLESETKERVFENVSKASTFMALQFDFRRQLAAVTTRDGHLCSVSHLGQPIDEKPDNKYNGYTALALAAPLGLLFAGTQQGSVRIFRWPLQEGKGSANPYTEISLHAHSITAMSLSGDARLLFSGDQAGTVMICEVGSTLVDKEGVGHKLSGIQLDQRFTKYRHREEDAAARASKEEDKKVTELQKKLTDARRGASAMSTPLSGMVMVPKDYFVELLGEIKELEDRMQNMKQENDHTLEQKDHEIQEKLSSIRQERMQEKKIAAEKYDSLFLQMKKASERHQQESALANTQFNNRTKELQEQFESNLSNEYTKQSNLLREIQDQKDQFEDEKRQVEAKHEEQLEEVRRAQEKAMREWRAEYDKVCNLLKSDGLKFEEAMRQQESEYEEQITEIEEHKRLALQVESEKSTTALKDIVSMKQTIGMLQNQLKVRDGELGQVVKEREDLRKKLEAAKDMLEKVKEQLKERERGLKVKEDTLAKVREQMKHLESFRFVLFHKVRALEEERDPLEEQVNSLKTSVRDMYGEFVREFRAKQKLDQQISEKTSLSSALQKENEDLRATLAKLKKDARHLLLEVEGVLHAETMKEFKQIPKRLQAVLEKHQGLSAWAPKKEPEGSPAEEAEQKNKEELMIQEMVVQRDLLFKKHQVSSGLVSHARKECADDVRRLTSENAQLIAEMNLLRNENTSYQRSYKELEAAMIAMKSKERSNRSMSRADSAPELGDSPSSVLSSGGGLPQAGGNGRPAGAVAGASVSDTPYMRRKVVDQKESAKRQRLRQMNHLPPLPHNAGE